MSTNKEYLTQHVKWIAIIAKLNNTWSYLLPRIDYLMQVKGSIMHAYVVTHCKQRPCTQLCKGNAIKAQYTNTMCVHT